MKGDRLILALIKLTDRLNDSMEKEGTVPIAFYPIRLIYEHRDLRVVWMERVLFTGNIEEEISLIEIEDEIRDDLLKICKFVSEAKRSAVGLLRKYNHDECVRELKN